MRIEFDHVPDTDNLTVGIQFILTEDPVALATLVELKNGNLDMTQSGWDVISGHPDYKGRTRYQVAIAEIVRKDDKGARSALGI